MPILNYTTKIEAEKTVAEIQRILARAGAKTVMIDYDDQHRPQAVTFFILVSGNSINFRLPVNHLGVMRALKNDGTIRPTYKDEAQSRRIAWRIIKDWIEAQVAIIQSGQVEIEEVFLPYAVMKDGQTLFQKFQSGTLLLGDGK